MPRESRILTHPGLAPLWESMERTRRQQQYTALGLMLFAFGTIVVGVVSRHLWWALVGGALATGALYWLYHLLTNQPISHWRREFRDDPDQIVWVYGMVTERMPFGFKMATLGTLHLVDRDGGMHCFGLKPKELKLVTKTLNRVLPHAEFGYSEDRELRYRGEVTDFTGRKFRGLESWDEEFRK